eukprot:TRINITY_DN32497_c0_g1_i1.p2 TRINITY_DN32497_c0_g1~~TRINITY_DN32497_c0_g1_i1.p2  ORF type:complete len:103 (-),score=3.71 TRINITY_DN32497_c0_g1_i1:147-455(-)
MIQNSDKVNVQLAVNQRTIIITFYLFVVYQILNLVFQLKKQLNFQLSTDNEVCKIVIRYKSVNYEFKFNQAQPNCLQINEQCKIVLKKGVQNVSLRFQSFCF